MTVDLWDDDPDLTSLGFMGTVVVRGAVSGWRASCQCGAEAYEATGLATRRAVRAHKPDGSRGPCAAGKGLT